MSEALEFVRDEIGRRMAEIEHFFKPGAKVTVLVRSPGHPDRDFILTGDDLDEIAAMIERRRQG